jgi:hypothetical protein
MIQLATDPNAGRMSFRPANEKPNASAPKRLRGGHAWPFLSRPVGEPTSRESGSPRGSEGSNGS